MNTYRVSATGARKGGIILLQEIFGITDHIKEQCRKFADAGYEVIAPELFAREKPGLNLGYTPEEITQAIAILRAHPFDQSLADVRNGMDLFETKEPVYVLGYCYGGSVTYASACRIPGIRAAASYYGGMLPALSVEKPLCPVLVHLGELDAEIPHASVTANLKAYPEVKVALYPAGHGFNSDRRADYDANCAKLAFERTLAFFGEHS